MKTKKIVSIAICAVMFAIALAVVISAIVPKNFSFNFDQPQSITVYKSGAQNGATYNKNDTNEQNAKIYNQILKLYNSSFKVGSLSAFFQGKAFSSVSTVDQYKNLYSIISGSGDSTYIELTFSQDQDVIARGVTLASNETTYRSVVIEITNSSTLTQVSAYLVNPTNQAKGSYPSYVKYTSYANFADLYDYLSNM